MLLPELTSLSQVAEIAKTLPAFDQASADGATDRQNQLTKPPGSLGMLEELAIFMAGWQRTSRPRIEKAQALVFAGNHGICARGVNPFPQEVTAQMVANFEHGGAAINQLCRANGADLSVVALDLDRPTADFSQSPAMSEADCLDAMNRGAGVVDPRAHILLLGEMGIGNSTTAAALAAAIIGGDPVDWVGAGTGSSPEGIALKAQVVAEGIARHGKGSPMEILASLGGREQAAICGAILAARAASVPVMLDGYICTAAAAPLFATNPDLLAHCLVGHASAEPGHRKLTSAFGKTPILDFSMRLGEGTGAALALGVLRSALACHNGMATFAEAGVAGG